MYNHIIVGTDGSGTASRAVLHAIDLAALSGARLHIATAGSDSFVYFAVGGVALPGTGELSPITLTEDLSTVVNEAASLAQERGVDCETHTIIGEAVDAICNLAEKLNVDLIVIGNRGMKGVQRYFWDSIPDAVSHKAPCNVLIVDTRDKK
jgi:nucleotide-binding universal stress UspA family protein